MKKLINRVDDVLTEALRGFGAVHADLVRVHEAPTFVSRAAPTPAGQVALISGGGSGHEPLHAGFVGPGMLHAACPGQVFTSPTPDQIVAAAQAVGGDAGVLLVVKNYEGDVMNFEMAAELLDGRHATVLIDDDVAVDGSTFTTGRRGVAGTVIVEKILGAAAEAGADLDTLAEIGRRVVRRTRSMGVALTSCTVPAAGGPTFALGDDEVEMGVGIHGEPGRRRIRLQAADAVAEEMVRPVLAELPAGDPVIALINGFGATPAMELYLMADAVGRLLRAQETPVARWLVGNWCTSLDMAGCSITLTAADDEMLARWDAPVHTPAMRW